MENFKYRIHPEDIAEELVMLSTNKDDCNNTEDYKDMLYRLLAHAENPYNDDMFRKFYRLLENIVDY